MALRNGVTTGITKIQNNIASLQASFILANNKKWTPRGRTWLVGWNYYKVVMIIIMMMTTVGGGPSKLFFSVWGPLTRFSTAYFILLFLLCLIFFFSLPCSRCAHTHTIFPKKVLILFEKWKGTVSVRWLWPEE